MKEIIKMEKDRVKETDCTEQRVPEKTSDFERRKQKKTWTAVLIVLLILGCIGILLFQNPWSSGTHSGEAENGLTETDTQTGSREEETEADTDNAAFRNELEDVLQESTPTVNDHAPTTDDISPKADARLDQMWDLYDQDSGDDEQDDEKSKIKLEFFDIDKETAVAEPTEAPE